MKPRLRLDEDMWRVKVGPPKEHVRSFISFHKELNRLNGCAPIYEKDYGFCRCPLYKHEVEKIGRCGFCEPRK